MKTTIRANHYGGMTLIEVLVVLVVLTILMLIILPAQPHRIARALRIQCVNNLKQTGLAYHVWEGDHGDQYPMAVSETNGGSMEFTTGPNAFRHYLVMSNELSTPRILVCPADSGANRFYATNWNIGNSNISYFVGVDAKEAFVTTFLSGDRNITNGSPLKNWLLELTTNSP